MRNWIPGHLRAVWFRWFLIAGVAWFVSHDLLAPIGAVALLLGAFLDDQTVHLSQLNHADENLSELEVLMKDFSWFVRPAGWVMAVAGAWLLIMANYAGP